MTSHRSPRPSAASTAPAPASARSPWRGRLWAWLSPALLFFLPTACWAASTPVAYVESASVKVLPTREVPELPGAAIALSAARNECEPFQIALYGGLSGVRGVTASLSDLSGPGGARIPAENVWLYRVDLVEVTKPSGSIGAVGTWPDPLVPARDELLDEARLAFPFDVGAGVTRAIWGEVLVPEDARAGQYEGTVWVEGEGFSAELPLTLTVHDFALPSTPALATAFLAWLPNICLAHTGDAECGGWSTAATLARRYETLALDHRLTLSNVWVGRDHAQDWSGFDRDFGPLLDGTAGTRLSGARMTSAQITGQRTQARFQSWTRHFRDRGWFARLYDYTADEPPYGSTFEEIPARAELAHGADEGLAVLVTTNVANASAHGLLEHLDVIAPVVNHIDTPEGGNQRARYDDFIAAGGRLWLYQSCMSHGCSFGGPTPGVAWPSYMVDVSAARNRLMQWALWRYRASGELYYETALAFSADPWSSVFQFSGNGDGTLFYPGTPARIGGKSHVPVASIRLKMIREGIEDFEYLHLLDELGAHDFAERVAAEVLPTAYGAHDDAARIERARQRLAEEIVRLSGGSTPPAPDDGDAGVADAGEGEGEADAGSGDDAPAHDAGQVPSPEPGDAGTDAGTGGDEAEGGDGGSHGEASEARSGCAGCSTTDGGGTGLIGVAALGLLIAVRRLCFVRTHQ